MTAPTASPRGYPDRLLSGRQTAPVHGAPAATATVGAPFDYFNFFEDCAGKGGPLFGPETFRRFFMKPYRRIIERLRRAGIESFWVDCDGDPGPLIPLWIDAGINCLWPLEQASGMDPRRLRKKFGRDLALCGGIDKRALAKGRRAIEKELRSKLPPLLAQGGYIPLADGRVRANVPFENYVYYRRMLEKVTRA